MQALSYCDGAPALLYACPPLPPLTLPKPGSLNTDPGEAPECPGVESWPAEFALLGRFGWAALFRWGSLLRRMPVLRRR
jgi:hypothetical protein